MKESSLENPQNKGQEMLVDDDKIASMADEFPSVRLELQKNDPSVAYLDVIEKVLSNYHIPFCRAKAVSGYVS